MDGRLSWWPILALVVVGAIALMLAVLPLVRRARQGRHREAAEQLAQAADADHEGASTRHEGGA